jgi:hypothetical protein
MDFPYRAVYSDRRRAETATIHNDGATRTLMPRGVLFSGLQTADYGDAPPLHSARIPSQSLRTAHPALHRLSQSLVTVWNDAFTLCLLRTHSRNTVCITPAGNLRGVVMSLGRSDVGQ